MWVYKVTWIIIIPEIKFKELSHSYIVWLGFLPWFTDSIIYQVIEKTNDKLIFYNSVELMFSFKLLFL